MQGHGHAASVAVCSGEGEAQEGERGLNGLHLDQGSPQGRARMKHLRGSPILGMCAEGQGWGDGGTGLVAMTPPRALGRAGSTPRGGQVRSRKPWEEMPR